MDVAPRRASSDIAEMLPRPLSLLLLLILTITASTNEIPAQRPLHTPNNDGLKFQLRHVHATTNLSRTILHDVTATPDDLSGLQAPLTLAQQHENNRLSFNLSLSGVGPPSPPNIPLEVPLMERTTVVLSVETNIWPLKPSASGSQPKREC